MHRIRVYMDGDGEATVEVAGKGYSALAAGSLFRTPAIQDAVKQARAMQVRFDNGSTLEPQKGDAF